MKLTKYEKETVISFNELDSTAEVYTYNKKLKNRLQMLEESHSNEFRFIRQDKTGAVTYIIPKRLISVRAPVSDAKKQQAREYAIKAGLCPQNRSNNPNMSDKQDDGGNITHLMI